MGYACPICGADQPDGEHLANHVAFTAMTRGGEHESWLDDAVPDWPDRNPETLAPDLVPHAPEIETDVVTDEGAHPAGLEGELGQHGGYGRDNLSGDDQAILEEAADLTRRMYGLDDADDDSDSSDSESE
jgi:hypothetical protein